MTLHAHIISILSGAHVEGHTYFKGFAQGAHTYFEGVLLQGAKCCARPILPGENVTPGACSFVENFVHFMLKIKTHSDLFNFWKFRGIRANGFKCFLRGYI